MGYIKKKIWSKQTKGVLLRCSREAGYHSEMFELLEGYSFSGEPSREGLFLLTECMEELTKFVLSEGFFAKNPEVTKRVRVEITRQQELFKTHVAKR